jgi:shikimate kinase
VAPALTRRHIALVGLSGAGKTTAGRLAAQRLGAPFIDLDDAIATRAGKSVSRIFAEDGEGAFRALERVAGAAALSGPPAVIALGGGYLMDDAARRGVLGAAVVVYLHTSPAAAASRLAGFTDRPLLGSRDVAATLAQLLAAREPRYREAPHVVTTDELDAHEVADQVVTLARERGGWVD